MRLYLLLILMLITLCICAIIFCYLSYITPTNQEEWQLPGIADKDFVGGISTLLGILFMFILIKYLSLSKIK